MRPIFLSLFKTECCVFHAPKKWNESDTESDDERPRREFNRHVHPPGWDASECAQVTVASPLRRGTAFTL
jgi:hypothetical protein